MRKHAWVDEDPVIYRPNPVNTFEFIVLAALRAKQLARGATARLDGDHKPFITAQLEVLAGKVQKIDDTAMPDRSDARPPLIPAPQTVRARAVYPDVSILRARPAHEATIGRRL